jgi:two-component system, NarL family, nitrate/nitrite response regulator NarL
MPITLVIADDHPLMLRALNDVLGSEPDFTVLAQCANGDEALHAVRAHRPDILVLDLRMPGRDGLSVLRQMKDENLPTRVVLLAASLEDEEMLEATRLGVGGVVLKEMAPRLLVQCIRKVHAGEPWLERRAAARAFETLLRREAGTREIGTVLTVREIEIVRMVAAGLRNKTIGERLSISEGTVKTHLHNIYEKLHVGSRSELIRYCHERGLI